MNNPDPLDTASDVEAINRDKQVQYIQSKVKPIPTSKICLQCEAKTINGARWCSQSCRDDYQAWNPEA